MPPGRDRGLPGVHSAFHSTPPLVLDAVHIVPPLPVDDVLLTDLSHSDLSRPFGIWAMAEDTDQSPPQTRVEITAGQRLLVLLRVTVETPAKGYSTTKKTFNVPFLLDTGSPQSFMCQEDYNKLGLDSARNVYIEGCAVNVRKSTEHFEDINLLGTDVLRKTSLLVNYTAGALHLGFFDQGRSSWYFTLYFPSKLLCISLLHPALNADPVLLFDLQFSANLRLL